jgi:hypothetical protein
MLMLPDMDHYVYFFQDGMGESSYNNSTASLTAINTGQGSWVEKHLMGGIITPAATPTTSAVVYDGSNVTVQITAAAIAPPLGVTEGRVATLYASNDLGYTYSSFAMTQSGNTFTYTGAQSGVWASPAQTVWFADVKDSLTVFTTTLDVDYRSTLPVYPAGFQQHLRPMP